MDLTWTDAEHGLPRRMSPLARDAHVPEEPLPSGDTREGFFRHVEWEKELFEARWSVVSWPEEYGGRGATLWEWLIFEEEYYRAGAPQRVTQNGIFLLAPTFFEFGTPATEGPVPAAHGCGRRPVVPGLERARTPAATWRASRAARPATTSDGGWRITGQKTWTTRGAFCNWLFGLFRTDPDAERHRGMTYLLVPLDAAGVTVRGVGRLDGDEGFAEVFFEDVFVPDDLRARRREQGLERRHGDDVVRAGADVAQSRPLHRGGRPVCSTWPGARVPIAIRACAIVWPRCGWTPRPIASTPSPTSPASSRVVRRARARA